MITKLTGIAPPSPTNSYGEKKNLREERTESNYTIQNSINYLKSSKSQIPYLIYFDSCIFYVCPTSFPLQLH